MPDSTTRLGDPMAEAARRTAPAADHRPTDQAVQLKQELFAAVDGELSRLRQVFTEELPRFNEALRRLEAGGDAARGGMSKRASLAPGLAESDTLEDEEDSFMPLRDHFHPPLGNLRHWEGFHATWPVMMVAQLRQWLPSRYFAEPRAHSGATVELDVSTFEKEDESDATAGNGNGGVATAVWAPPRPTRTIATDLPAQDEYQVRVYDQQSGSRLVAAVEVVSPANKDRPEHRHLFAAKWAALLRELVSVVVIDVVTNRTQDLYAEFLDLIGQASPSHDAKPASPYAVASRMTKQANEWNLETWSQPLGIGTALPTMPLWLADNLAVPLELEASYAQSCSILGIP